jgi:uncharacterized repeat protein (TIGR04138 family)
MSENLLDQVREVASRNGSYSVSAYLFVFESLDYTVKNIAGEKRHVTGRELIEGLRRLAIEQFGPMAMLVLHRWGVRSTRDVGAIVFHLVDSGLMGKTENDSLEDFADGFDFERAFSLDETVRLGE